jgi:hypothetical protein
MVQGRLRFAGSGRNRLIGEEVIIEFLAADVREDASVDFHTRFDKSPRSD